MISQTQKDFMLGALLGGTAGAAAALLLTPFSGPQLRQKVVGAVPHRAAKKRKKVSRKTKVSRVSRLHVKHHG